MSDRLIATVRKNAREEIRVTRGDFKGHDIVGLRVWFEDRASGEMRPGKDGLAFRAESRRRDHRGASGCEDRGRQMTARRKKAAPHAGPPESTVYLGRDAVGSILVVGKGQVT